jgi:arginase
MSLIDLIGVPFDGYGRPGNQARAAAALRDAGLLNSFGGRSIRLQPDITLPPQTRERAVSSGLMNEPALIAMVETLHMLVRDALAAGRFPMVYGADCSVLLGILPALRDVAGEAGLLFVDGHEDAVTMNASPDGEVANMEIALLLGLTGNNAPEALRKRLPALQPNALAMLGQRDGTWIRKLGVASVSDLGVMLLTPDDIAIDPAQRARDAVGYVVAHAPRWWLHIDLDVLAEEEFAAARIGPEDPALPGGLRWDELTALVSAVFRAGGCVGCSLVIYNPDRDANGAAGRRIVQFVADVAPAIPSE